MMYLPNLNLDLILFKWLDATIRDQWRQANQQQGYSDMMYLPNLNLNLILFKWLDATIRDWWR